MKRCHLQCLTKNTDIHPSSISKINLPNSINWWMNITIKFREKSNCPEETRFITEQTSWFDNHFLTKFRSSMSKRIMRDWIPVQEASAHCSNCPEKTNKILGGIIEYLMLSDDNVHRRHPRWTISSKYGQWKDLTNIFHRCSIFRTTKATFLPIEIHRIEVLQRPMTDQLILANALRIRHDISSSTEGWSSVEPKKDTLQSTMILGFLPGCQLV